MRVLVQHTLAIPGDWVELDLTPSGLGAKRWRNLPKLPVPVGGELLTAPGYIFDVCIQGWQLRGADHYALAPLTDGSGGVRAWRWCDDLADVETDYRWGQVIEFRPGWADRTLVLPNGSTIRHQGPDQRLTEYAENMVDRAKWKASECGGLAVELKPWSQWPAPDERDVRHGIWVSDTLLATHLARQRPVDWREWVTS